jgi:cytochrome P450
LQYYQDNDFDHFLTTFQTAFLTIDHDHHRLRRNALNRYFSKTAVNKFEPYISSTAEKLCKKLEMYANLGPVTISTAYSSFTTDVITEYCFENSYNFLDGEDFLPNLQAGNDSLGELLPLLKQMPWMHSVMRLVPS